MTPGTERFTPKIPPYVTEVLSVFRENGHAAYLVGGCVRDMLRGVTPSDYDMTTDATPDEMMSFLSGRFRVIPTGIAHGTLTVLSDGHPLEITTFRTDGDYADHRHPTSVSFSADLREDLARRDFTVNAMAYAPDVGLTDIFGGTDDLQRCVIRCVGEPEKRFDEDALRILRALRFAAVLDFAVEPQTADAARRASALLQKMSKERITAELLKMLDTPHADALERIWLSFTDVFSVILPFDKSKTRDFPSFCREIARISGGALSRLAYFAYVFDGLSALPEYLRLSNKQFCYVKTVSEALAAVSSFEGELGAKRYASAYGLTFAKETAKILSDVTGERKMLSLLENIENDAVCLSVTELALTGDDLKQMGYTGRRIGEILQTALEACWTGKAENTRESLTAYVRSACKR